MLDQLFKTYTKNLYRYGLFYLPKINSFDYGELQHLLNKVLIIKEDGAMYELKEGSGFYYANSKKKELTKNVFLLLEHKETLNKEQFEFLTKQYVPQIAHLVDATQWMSDHLKEHIAITDDQLQLAFNLQTQLLKEHQEIVLKHLEIPKEVSDCNRNAIPNDFEKQIEDLKEILLQNTKRELPIAIDSKKQSKKKKFKAVTELEAELDLLEKVFNVK